MAKLVVVLLALAALAPATARGATCAGLGPAAAFDVLSAGAYRAQNTQVQGRVAAGGDVTVSSYGVGTALPSDAARADLIAGGALSAANAQAAHGSVTYATTLTGTIATPSGTLRQAAAPFSFPSAFADLEALSARLSDLPANGTITGPTYGALQLTGTDPARNAFTITAARLQTAQQIQLRVPFGATTVITVTGTTYSTATLPTTSVAFWNGSSYVQFGDVAPTPQLDALRTALLWNFPLANRIQIGPNLAWQGSVLAPDPMLSFPGSTQLEGQIAAASVIGDGTVVRHPFTGCLPPAPTHDLALTALCRDPVSNVAELRLRNTGDHDVDVRWEDRDSAQAGTLTARAGTDTFFGVRDGDQDHRITVTAPTETATADTLARACVGTIVVRKVVTGDGTPPDGPWRITLDGDNGYRGEAQLAGGETAAFSVPGDYQPGSAAIGKVVGGATYTVSEPDPRGALATLSQEPVTILDGQAETVAVGNAYTAVAPPPVPPVPDPDPALPEPGGPVLQPSQPTLVPGAPAPLPGPGLVVAQSAAAAPDLAVTERITPERTTVGRVARLVTTVRNQGTATADDVVLRELPQADPAHPNSVVRVVSVSGGGLRCTSVRPVRCTLGSLAPGASRTIRARGRVLLAGALKSVVIASSPTPESNITNNVGTDGIVVLRRAAPLRVSVRSPAVVRVGDAVRYRVAVSAPRAGVSEVRVCHRPSRGLLVRAARGTLRVGGRLCLDIGRLAAGRTRGFTVRAVASAQFAGRRVLLAATADSPDRRRPAAGAARTRIVAATPSGLG